MQTDPTTRRSESNEAGSRSHVMATSTDISVTRYAPLALIVRCAFMHTIRVGGATLVCITTLTTVPVYRAQELT